MADDEDRPKARIAHVLGEPLDALSLHEFDERIALLQAEIERLKAARLAKRSAADVAGSVFKSRS